jgi:hypothetical protein
MSHGERTTTPAPRRRPSRRAFLGALAAAPAVPFALEAPPAGAPSPSSQEGVADALAQAAKRESGAELEGKDVEAVRRQIARGLEAADRLRAAARLENGDGPVNRFEARPPGEAHGGRR